MAMWMQDHGMEGSQASYLVDQFRKLGLQTLLAVIPGDERFAADAGFYVGGDPSIKSTGIEDVLIKSAGLLGAALTVTDIGNGWFFIGLNGDGVIEGASQDDALALSELLERIGDRPFIAAVSIPRTAFALNRAADRAENTIKEIARAVDAEGRLREGGFVDSSVPVPTRADIEQVAKVLPSGQSRLVRRVRAFLDQAGDADALCATLADDRTFSLLLVFPSKAKAESFLAAVADIRRDMRLAVDGAEERGSFSRSEADAARTELERIDFKNEGASVLMFEVR
jgi:hypothetical protein